MPIVMVTHRDGERDVVQGLTKGADDYVVKPVRGAELKARLLALLRRAYPEQATLQRHGPYEWNVSTRAWSRDGEPIETQAARVRPVRLPVPPDRAGAVAELPDAGRLGTGRRGADAHPGHPHLRNPVEAGSSPGTRVSAERRVWTRLPARSAGGPGAAGHAGAVARGRRMRRAPTNAVVTVLMAALLTAGAVAVACAGRGHRGACGATGRIAVPHRAGATGRPPPAGPRSRGSIASRACRSCSLDNVCCCRWR